MIASFLSLSPCFDMIEPAIRWVYLAFGVGAQKELASFHIQGKRREVLDLDWDTTSGMCGFDGSEQGWSDGEGSELYYRVHYGWIVLFFDEFVGFLACLRAGVGVAEREGWMDGAKGVCSVCALYEG